MYLNEKDKEQILNTYRWTITLDVFKLCNPGGAAIIAIWWTITLDVFK